MGSNASRCGGGLAALIGVQLLASAAAAEIAISVNDNKLKLLNGVTTVVQNPPPDTAAVIDLKQSPPRVLAEINVPASVIGPPLSVAITPDEGLALITSAMKIDPADPSKQVADNRMSVLDLRASPPAVITTLETGNSPAGVSISRDGSLALVANAAEGTVSIFTVSGKAVTPAGKVTVGDEKSGVNHVAISPDGKMGLVTRTADNKISVLSIDGTNVQYTKRDLSAGLRPYGVDISPRGDIAVVSNVGTGSGDADTISIIDIRAKPARIVNTVTVGQTPEGMKLSPDGSLLAVVVVNGSNKPKESPFFADQGKLVLFRVDGQQLVRVGEAPVGRWSQGVAFSHDGRTILVQNMVENDVVVFRLDGGVLQESGRIALRGGGAAIRTADRPG